MKNSEIWTRKRKAFRVGQGGSIRASLWWARKVSATWPGGWKVYLAAHGREHPRVPSSLAGFKATQSDSPVPHHRIHSSQHPTSGPIFHICCSVAHAWLFATPWTAARQASLSFTISQSLLKPLSQSEASKKQRPASNTRHSINSRHGWIQKLKAMSVELHLSLFSVNGHFPFSKKMVPTA